MSPPVLLCKLFERKTDRDLPQIALLSLIVAIAAMMFSPSGIGFALLAGVFSVVLVYGGMLLAARRNACAASSMASIPLSPGAMRSFFRDLRSSLKPAFLLIVPIALLVFILLPRSGSTGFVSTWNGQTIETGFAETVQFHDFEQLTQSDDIVMQVRFTQGRDGPNIGSAFYQPYLRGQVLDFDRKFSRAVPQPGSLERDKTVRIGANLFQVAPVPDSNAGFIAEEFTVYRPARSLLFAAGSPAYVQSDQFSTVWYNGENGTLYHSDGASPLRYIVFSPTRSDSAKPFDADGPPPLRDQPVINADVIALARKIAPGLPDEAPVPPDRVHDVASSFESYLRTHYPYSLSTYQVDDKLDPVSDFLLNRGRDQKNTGGFCEYFAASFVMLCRSVGIDARMVTGYYGGEFNSVGGYYIVREKDAHAWAEYFVPGQGWLSSDPTSSEQLPDATASFLGRWVRETVQVGETAWLSLVVTFDNDSRRRLFAWIADLIAGPATRELIAGWWPFALEAAALVLVAVAAGRLLLFDGKGRRLFPGNRAFSAAGTPALPADAAFLSDLLACLGRISPRRAYLTPSEFAKSLPLGSARDDVHWLIDTAYRVLWGGVSLTGAQQEQIAAALARIRHAFPPIAPGPAR